MKHFSMKHFFDAARMVGVAAVVMLVAGCASTLPPKYQSGQIFRDAFPVSAVASKTSAPLPPGEWKLLAYGTERGFGGSSVASDVSQAMLVQTEGDKLARFVYVGAKQGKGIFYWNLKPHGCFPEPSADIKEWVLHTERVVDANAGESSAHDCWRIGSWWMGKFNSQPNDSAWNRAFQTMRNLDIAMPERMVVVQFLQTSRVNFHRITYGFNAEIDGDLTRFQNEANKWSVHSIQHHPVNLRYIESKKRWADKWRAKVNDGITGKLPIAVAQ